MEKFIDKYFAQEILLHFHLKIKSIQTNNFIVNKIFNRFEAKQHDICVFLKKTLFNQRIGQNKFVGHFL